MSTHSFLATIPCGDPDIGAEVEAMVTFTYLAGSPDTYDEPGYAAEVELVKAEPYCNGKPSLYCGAFADLELSHLQALAEAWLESDAGYAEALAVVADDDERGREYAADLRADR